MQELVGLGAFLSALVEVAKRVGIIPDGYGGLAAVIVNVVVFAIAEIAVGYFGVDLSTLDGILAMAASLVTAIVASLVTHKAGRAMRVW